jgi:hypothetical protein
LAISSEVCFDQSSSVKVSKNTIMSMERNHVIAKLASEIIGEQFGPIVQVSSLNLLNLILCKES